MLVGVVLRVLLGFVLAAGGSPTTAPATSVADYDAPVVTRVDVHWVTAAAVATDQLSAVSGEPASPSVVLRVASTTPTPSVNAASSGS